MDTRFWGPSGWRLLHLITFAYNRQRDKAAMLEFLETLPYVLPCKFCRSSLIEYYEELPPKDALASRDTLTKWMWKIHGKVNQKLRSQGQSIPPDPTFQQVANIYTERLSYGCTRTDFPGWEFLFSIVENHPLSSGAVSTPIPGAPPITDLDPTDEKTLLKWNYLPPARRFPFLCQFWKTLPLVLPFAEWRTSWIRYGGSFCRTTWQSKRASVSALWKVRCAIEKELDLLNRTQFRQLCNDLRVHRSGCSSAKNARTCRAKKQSMTRRKKRSDFEKTL